MNLTFDPNAPLRIPLEPLYWDKNPHEMYRQFEADDCACWEWMEDTKYGAHEPPAILRVFNAGARGPLLSEAMGGMTILEMKHRLTIALEDQNEAARVGRKIHDGLIKKGTV